MFFISLSERTLLPGIAFSIAMLVLTLVFGRFFCGWVCPLGTVNDGIGALRKKKFVPGDARNRKIRIIKYFVLALIAGLALLGVQAAWFFDPIVILARFVSLNLIPSVTLAVNQMFVGAIQNLHLNGAFYDFYRELKSSFLGVHPYYFSSSGMIFAFFLLVTLPVLFLSRFWCRMICPLGAMYGLQAKPAFLERTVGACSGCGLCKTDCRMGAILDNQQYVKSECILCMDCVDVCPVRGVQFEWRGKKNRKMSPKNPPANGITRKDFLFLLASPFLFFGFGEARTHWKEGEDVRSSGAIRPPGALKEPAFLDRCIRCGNCMKVCVTNGLQPVVLETGLEGIWTPRLVPEIGYCEYNCTLCGNVCPTGAIPPLPLEVKQKTKLGTAHVDRSRCIAWAENKECIVCEEHCPVGEKAIKLETSLVAGKKIFKPVVDPNLCVGCGVCQNVCPVDPIRAIRVTPSGAHRS